MSPKTIELLQKKKKSLIDNWIQLQLENETLRDDLVSNEESSSQSDELMTALLNAFKNGNFSDIDSSDYDEVMEIVSGLSLSRAIQGFSPRETGIYMMCLKNAFINVIER